MKTKVKFIFCLAACVTTLSIFSSCVKDIRTPLDSYEPYDTLQPGGPRTAPRTFIVYMGGDNNLTNDLQANINQMVKGAAGRALRGGRILIYYSPVMDYDGRVGAPTLPYTTPQLLEVSVVNGVSSLRVLKSYEKQSSVSPAVLRQVLADVFRLAPSNSYCIDFSSHGSGWWPAGNTTDDATGASPALAQAAPASGVSAASSALAQAASDPVVVGPPAAQAWGLDGKSTLLKSMNIDDLAAALPDHKFDFIMFDACLMGSVEVAYELRDKTDYVISSVAEIPGAGFPYDKLIPHIFAGQPDLRGICNEYIASYNSWSAATISICETAKLPALAAVTRTVVQQYGDELKALPIIPSNWSNPVVQYYYTVSNSDNVAVAPTALDMCDAMDTLLRERDPAMLAAWQRALGDAVVYHRATDYSINSHTLFGTSSRFDNDRYSGITMHIPSPLYDQLPASGASAGWNDFFYTRTEWGRDVFGQ